MSDKWDFYLTGIENKPASVFLDIGIAHEAPMEDYRVRLVVLVKLKHPSPEGLTTKEEAERLWPLEDALVQAVHAWGGLFVGRITTDGRRDFVFYGSSANGFDAAVSLALEPLGYEFDTLKQADAGWTYYFDVLYPTPQDGQRIMNRHVLEALQRGGDDLSKPRRIFHWLYFSTEDGRDHCAAVARQNGFGTRIVPTVEKPNNKYPLGLQLHRIDSVAPQAIDELSIALFQLANDHSGHYDGWETQVVKAGQEPIDDAPAS